MKKVNWAVLRKITKSIYDIEQIEDLHRIYLNFVKTSNYFIEISGTRYSKFSDISDMEKSINNISNRKERDKFKKRANIFTLYLNFKHKGETNFKNLLIGSKGVNLKSDEYNIAWMYSKIRKNTYYKVLKEIHLGNTCFYCNENSIYVSINAKFLGQIDHIYNKKEYPLLAININNFIPSCGICNQKLSKKSNIKDPAKLVQKYSTENYKFYLDSTKILTNYIKHRNQTLELDIIDKTNNTSWKEDPIKLKDRINSQENLKRNIFMRLRVSTNPEVLKSLKKTETFSKLFSTNSNEEDIYKTILLGTSSKNLNLLALDKLKNDLWDLHKEIYK